MTIAQMTNQIKEEVGTGPKKTKRIGQYTEVIGNPNTIAMDKESIGEMSFQAAQMTVQHTTQETIEAVKNLKKQVQKKKVQSR